MDSSETSLFPTPDLLSASAALVVESRHRLALARTAIRHPFRRRHLISGGASEPTIAERIRAALVSGALPCIGSDRSWAGHGTGRPCGVCGLRIEPTQIEHEVDVPGAEPVHAACLMIWREESRQLSPRREP